MPCPARVPRAAEESSVQLDLSPAASDPAQLVQAQKRPYLPPVQLQDSQPCSHQAQLQGTTRGSGDQPVARADAHIPLSHWPRHMSCSSRS